MTPAGRRRIQSPGSTVPSTPEPRRPSPQGGGGATTSTLLLRALPIGDAALRSSSQNLFPHLTLADPVVVLEPDTSVVLHERPPRITAMSGPLPGQQRPVELPVGLGDDDRLSGGPRIMQATARPTWRPGCRRSGPRPAEAAVRARHDGSDAARRDEGEYWRRPSRHLGGREATGPLPGLNGAGSGMVPGPRIGAVTLAAVLPACRGSGARSRAPLGDTVRRWEIASTVERAGARTHGPQFGRQWASDGPRQRGGPAVRGTTTPRKSGGIGGASLSRYSHPCNCQPTTTSGM